MVKVDGLFCLFKLCNTQSVNGEGRGKKAARPFA
jgi:hypothetical protein